MDDGQSARNLSELVEQYYQLLYRYAYRLTGSVADAEDLTQQAFLTAHSKFHQLRELSRAKSWLCSIVRNAYLKGLRNRNDANAVSLEKVPEPQSNWHHSSAIDEEELQNILNEMPEEFRSPLILFYFEEFSYKEIAEQMEVPIGTVMSRLARAKRYMRGRLAAESYRPKHNSGTSAETAKR